MTDLTDEHGEDEDAEEPVEGHEHVLDLDGRHGVVADRRRRLRRQVHAVQVTARHTLLHHHITHRILTTTRIVLIDLTLLTDGQNKISSP